MKKRFLVGSVAFLMTAGLAFGQVRPSSVPGPLPVNKGDVNNDGKIDIQDAILAGRIATGMVVADSEMRARADVAPVASDLTSPPGDGKVDVADMIRLLRISVGLDSFNDSLYRGNVVEVKPPATISDIAIMDNGNVALLTSRGVVTVDRFDGSLRQMIDMSPLSPQNFLVKGVSGIVWSRNENGFAAISWDPATAIRRSLAFADGIDQLAPASDSTVYIASRSGTLDHVRPMVDGCEDSPACFELLDSPSLPLTASPAFPGQPVATHAVAVDDTNLYVADNHSLFVSGFHRSGHEDIYILDRQTGSVKGHVVCPVGAANIVRLYGKNNQMIILTDTGSLMTCLSSQPMRSLRLAGNERVVGIDWSGDVPTVAVQAIQPNGTYRNSVFDLMGLEAPIR